MKVILNKINQAVKQLGNQLGNRRCSSANGLFTSEIVGAVTSLIFMLVLGFVNTGDVSAAQSTITMNVASSIVIDVLPTTNGTFASSDTTSDTISITTNNSTGYTLSITASNNSNALVNTSDSTKTISSITNTVSEANYSDDNNATTYNDTWGYRPSKLNSTTNSNYLPAPTSTTTATILETTNQANTTANTYNIAIGARISNNTAPGSYGNTFIITAIANAMPYTITYNQNTTDTVSNMPANVTNGATYADTVSLSSTIPTRTGYDFAGWCIGTSTSSNVTTTAGVDSCSSTTISAGGNITLDQTSSSNNFYLYAMWKKSKLYFQDATPEDCGQTMYDNRGTDTYKNVAYTTATINDLCWMTRNLDLPGGTTLNSSDTNLNGATTSYALPASSTSGFSDDATAYVYNSDNTNFNDTSCGNSNPCYSYYSYAAATAGTNPSSGNASSDICPKGWRLPTQAEFATLKNTYATGATLTQSPFLGVYAGDYSYSRFYYGGTYGHFWSSTANASGFAYYLHFSNSEAAVMDDSGKLAGYSIRCVMKDTRTIADMEYMQDINTDIVQNTAEGATMTLKDKRDEQSYTVAKINDQLWMTQNLRFQGTSLNSATSNVASTYTEASPYNITWRSLKNTSGCKGTSATTNNTTYMCKEDSGNTTTGVWYNYSAATAHTITGTSNSTAATYDICPKNWHLPTGPNTTGGTDFNKLVGNTTSGWQDPTTGLTAFSAVAGGYYYNGSLYSTGLGFWWSATAFNTTNRYSLHYNSSDGQFYGDRNGSRYSGGFVRCVRN